MRVCLFALLTFAILVAACGSQVESPESGKSVSGRKEKKIKIGFAMDTLKEERWQRDHDAFKAQCEVRNVECVITVADNRAEKQANDVENLLTQGIDVLVIAPSNAKQAATLVDKAKAQGIPVISYDRLIDSDKLDLYISHQVPIIGRRIAEYALARVPSGNYVMVYGASTDNNASIMKKEQMAVLQPAIDRGDVKIVAEQFIDGWSNSLALNFVENTLTRNNDDIQAIVVSNDGMAGGVVSALAKKGLDGKIVVTGQDAQLDALQRIAEGKQAMTVYKAIIPLANSAVDAAIKLAGGEKPESQLFMNDAINKEVPAILLEVVTVDRTNLMDTVVKDGYSKYEDVYRNVPENERPPRP